MKKAALLPIYKVCSRRSRPQYWLQGRRVLPFSISQVTLYLLGHFVLQWPRNLFREKKRVSSIVEVYSCNLKTNLSLCFVSFTVVDFINMGLQCHSVGNRKLYCVTSSLRSVVRWGSAQPVVCSSQHRRFDSLKHFVVNLDSRILHIILEQSIQRVYFSVELRKP